MSRTCIDCGTAIDERSNTGRCIEHYRQWMKDAGPADGVNDAHRSNVLESNRAMVRALRRYADKYHPGAPWLGEGMGR